MVPNVDGTMGHKIKTRKHPWHETLCVIRYPTNRNPTQSLQENSITVFGPRLYNSLPKYVRYIESVKIEKFKFALDKFLELITDEPKIPNYVTAAGSNSILDQLTYLRAQGIYQGGGVPDCFETTPSIPTSIQVPYGDMSYIKIFAMPGHCRAWRSSQCQIRTELKDQVYACSVPGIQ